MSYYGYGCSNFDQGAALSRKWRNWGGKKPKKTVFSGDQAIHVWAQRVQEYGRNSKGTSFFEGDSLYSYGYHFTVARFHTTKRGQLVCLFNSGKYSNTTSGQQWAARCAVKDSTPKFFVANPNATTESEHARNFKDILEGYSGNLEKAKNRRVSPGNRAAAMARLPEILETARAYRNAFLPASKYKLPKLPANLETAQARENYEQAAREFLSTVRNGATCYSAPKGTLAGVVYQCGAVLNKWQALQDAANAAEAAGNVVTLPAFDPAPYIKRKAEAEKRKANLDAMKSNFSGSHHWGDSYVRRERDAIAAIDKRNNFARATIDSALYWVTQVETNGGEYLPSSDLADLLRIPAHCAKHGLPVPSDLDSVMARYKAAESQVERNKKERERLAKASNAEKIEAWRNGKSLSLPYDLPTMIRLRHDGMTLQTSKGAEFPAEHARKAWPLIKALYEHGKAWKRNGQTIRLGLFQIDEIKADGNVIAGCHIIGRDEIEHTAKILNLA